MDENQQEIDIVRSREIASRNISQMGIYRSVVENVVQMEGEVSDKIGILLQAIPDLGVIMSQLSLCKSRGILDNEDYTNLLNNCLLKVNNSKQNIDFDPTSMIDELNGA